MAILRLAQALQIKSGMLMLKGVSRYVAGPLDGHLFKLEKPAPIL